MAKSVESWPWPIAVFSEKQYACLRLFLLLVRQKITRIKEAVQLLRHPPTALAQNKIFWLSFSCKLTVIRALDTYSENTQFAIVFRLTWLKKKESLKEKSLHVSQCCFRNRDVKFESDYNDGKDKNFDWRLLSFSTMLTTV